MPTLLPGSTHFIVEELPLYAATGRGEHLYVQIEKEGLTSDQVAEALARCCGVAPRAVGCAGRKDRHAITRQWFSVLGGREEALTGLAQRLPHGRIAVLAVTRHGNKLRIGHLAGNRFRLGLGGVDDLADLQAALDRLVREGISNRFGPQRFGARGATLRTACAYGAGRLEEAIAWVLDPDGTWRWGDPLPEGFRPGFEGRVLGALRQGAAPERALAAPGEGFRKLLASAAQSAVFNAIHDARATAGLLRRLRTGDLACLPNGAPFLVEADRLADSDARAERLAVYATAPLPGCSRLAPAPAVAAEERAWSAATGVDWSWFDRGGRLESPGERRPLLTVFQEAPALKTEASVTWLSFALGSGSYATEVLTQCGVGLPERREG